MGGSVSVDPLSALRVVLIVYLGVVVFAVAIELVKVADGGTVPPFPPMCKASISARDDCTFMGITIPCFKIFDKDTAAHFGMGLEMSAIWTFVVTFIIGFVPLCKIVDDIWVSRKNDWKTSSLQIACALYAMETAVFALIRYYWGVCKPLVGECLCA